MKNKRIEKAMEYVRDAVIVTSFCVAVPTGLNQISTLGYGTKDEVTKPLQPVHKLTHSEASLAHFGMAGGY